MNPPARAHWFEPLAEFMGPAYLRYSFTKGTEQEVGFLVGAAGLMVVAYRLDKRFKLTPTAAAQAAAAQAPPVAAAPVADVPAPDAPPAGPAPTGQPSVPPPSLLPIGDLNAEHARLTRELTDRVDDDEDVRFEKFMRLRRIEEEIERQKGAPPA